MTDTYTEDEIREAWTKCYNPCHWKDMDDRSLKELIAALQKPKFAEGQVFYHSSPGGVRPQYDVYCHDGGYDTTPSSRPLTLTEHGPAVRALRGCVEISIGRTIGTLTADLHKALAAFDEAIHD